MKIMFKFRAFTTLLTAWSVLISLFSGIILYFTPQGKIAHWTHWTLLGLDKETWAALHINSSLIFFIIIFFHIYYNWSVLINYITRKSQATLNRKWELFIATLLAIFITLASIYHWQPFATIIKWNTDIKNYWAQKESQPPIPHAEEMSLREFSGQFNVPLNYITSKMQEIGLELKGMNQTIQEIADQNNISPSEFYQRLELTRPSGPSQKGQGQGWGRMTVTQASRQIGIDPETALKNLRQAGILASPGSNLKDLANQAQKSPSEIMELMQKEK